MNLRGTVKTQVSDVQYTIPTLNGDGELAGHFTRSVVVGGLSRLALWGTHKWVSHLKHFIRPSVGDYIDCGAAVKLMVAKVGSMQSLCVVTLQPIRFSESLRTSMERGERKELPWRWQMDSRIVLAQYGHEIEMRPDEPPLAKTRWGYPGMERPRSKICPNCAETNLGIASHCSGCGTPLL